MFICVSFVNVNIEYTVFFMKQELAAEEKMYNIL